MSTRQVQLARDAGFDGVFIGHHLSYEGAVWLPPLPTLARVIKVKARKPGGKLKRQAPPERRTLPANPSPLNRSRVTTSQLEHPGLGDFMAASPDAYAAKAIEFATTRRSDLQALRTTLREQFLTSSLCDAASLVGALEQHFRQAWQRWCSPRDFA